ncbi:MAG: DNA starvation/stationary phase protection protein [Gammaproteobacteria bacterium]|nr:DNA starvation/stationary phase protection protein [Gammaproteobacteria bacterium]
MATNQATIDVLSPLLADTYVLYVKTQNFHWHVKSPRFKMLHEMFEGQYEALAEAADTLAERIIILGGQAPATLEQFLQLKTIDEGDSSLDATAMVKTLADDHHHMVSKIKTAITAAHSHDDEATVSILTDRLVEHEKTLWMLRSSQK